MTEAFLRRARTFGPALAVSLTLLSTTGAASAQCVDGTPFRPAPGGAPICTSPSAGVLDCDTDLAAGPVNVVAYAVLEPSSNRIEVFGNDSLGRPFCDQIPATGINDFRLRGSANPDVLSFYYTFGGARWDLAPGGIGLSASAYGRRPASNWGPEYLHSGWWFAGACCHLRAWHGRRARRRAGRRHR